MGIGDIIIKVVNAAAKPYATNIVLQGVDKVEPVASLITLLADKPEAENSLDEPEKYTPRQSTIAGIKKSFSQTFPPYSISVLRIKAKTTD